MRHLHTTHSTTCHVKSDSYICHELNETFKKPRTHWYVTQTNYSKKWFIHLSWIQWDTLNPRTQGYVAPTIYRHTAILLQTDFDCRVYNYSSEGNLYQNGPLMNFKLDCGTALALIPRSQTTRQKANCRHELLISAKNRQLQSVYHPSASYSWSTSNPHRQAFFNSWKKNPWKFPLFVKKIVMHT